MNTLSVIDTQALQSAGTHLVTLYDHDAARHGFDGWLGRAGVVLALGGLFALQAMGAPEPALSTAAAWGYVAGALATAIGGVCCVARAASGPRAD